MVRRILSRVRLDEVEDLEVARAQQTDPVAMAHLELSRVVVFPVEPVQPALWTLQCLARAAERRRAQDGERRVAQENELAARSEQPSRFGDPLVRIAPNRCAVL